MKLITRDTDYTVRALCYIAQKKDCLVSANELVKELKVPRPFLRKLLQILNKKKILHSFKGQGGGFRLAMPKEEIFLVDLIKIFQGPFRLNKCILKKGLCPDRAACLLRGKINRIESQVIRELKSITIASLL